MLFGVYDRPSTAKLAQIKRYILPDYIRAIIASGSCCEKWKEEGGKYCRIGWAGYTHGCVSLSEKESLRERRRAEQVNKKDEKKEMTRVSCVIVSKRRRL